MTGARVVRMLLLPALLSAACRCGGGDSAADADAEAGCTFASCDEQCRAMGRCYGSCARGICGCVTECADADGGAGDAGRDESPVDDGDRDDATDADDGEVVVEIRAGGSPGVVCRKVPSPSRNTRSQHHGEGSYVVFAPEIDVYADRLVLIDWSSGDLRTLDDLSELPGVAGKYRGAESPSLEYPRVAYGVGFAETFTRCVAWLVLLDIESGDKRVVSEIAGQCDRGGAGFWDVQLRYPWLGWIEWGENPLGPEATYTPDAYAVNLETGQRMVVEPPMHTSEFDLLGTTAVLSLSVIHEVDLLTGRMVQISSAPPSNGTWEAAITPDWIAWLDQRNRPSCDHFSPCDTEIWGFDRRTRTEVLLLDGSATHGPELDGEGEWLAYTDQRDNPNPHGFDDWHQNIYALHLPTRTEVCVENWPGNQFRPRVYRGVDEWRVLFVEEVSYLPTEMDLWDCSLPRL